MAVGGTTVGPLAEEVRDRLKHYRDEHELQNYNEALEQLLNERAE